MINLPPLSASSQNFKLDFLSSDENVISSNQQDAAFASIATSGCWDSQYMDLVAPSLPKLSIWPADRGLVIIEGARVDYYDAAGSRSINIADMNLNNDVVIKRVNNNHYNVLLPSGEREMAADGDCLFRAVITGLNGNLEDSVICEYIQELRTRVAEYVFENWDTLKDFVIQEDDRGLESYPYEELNYLSSQFYSFQGGPEVDKSTHVYSSFSNKITPPPLPTSKIPQLDATVVTSRAAPANSQDAVRALAGSTKSESLNSRQLNRPQELVAMFEYRALQASLESYRINKLAEGRDDSGIYENDSWPEFASIASQNQDAFSNLSTPTPAESKTTRAVEQFKLEPEIGKPSMVTMLMNQLKAMLASVLDALRGTKPLNVKEMDGLAKLLRMINRSMTEAPPSEKAVWAERGLTELFSRHPGSQLSKAESILKHRDVPALKPVAYELMIFMQDAAHEFIGSGKNSATSRTSSPEAPTSRAVNEFRAIFERLQDEYGMAF